MKGTLSSKTKLYIYSFYNYMYSFSFIKVDSPSLRVSGSKINGRRDFQGRFFLGNVKTLSTKRSNGSHVDICNEMVCG